MHHLITYPKLFRHYPDLYLLAVALWFCSKWIFKATFFLLKYLFKILNALLTAAGVVLLFILEGVLLGLMADSVSCRCRHY